VRTLPLLFAIALCALAQNAPFRVYVADLDSSSITLAWGRADGVKRNTIGRDAEPGGTTTVQIDGRTLTTDRPWLRVDHLKPDTLYPYSVSRNGDSITAATRTWPVQADSLSFFVIGDYGTGSKAQMAIAARMAEEFKRLESQGRHVRFVISTGDIIYGKFSASGADDRDWESKFFSPYQDILRAIPFKTILGNHDGNQSESARDLEVCLDNLFMPGRWYRFNYASFAEFLFLDTTTNQPDRKPEPMHLPNGEQSNWFAAQLAKPPLPWRIVAMHHPMFTAGPNHKPFLEAAPHWFLAMRSAGVQTVFSGHEHNLQISENNEATGNMQFIVAGAGGELRPSSVRKKMAERHIAAWSNQNHFVVVHIDGRDMTIEPIGFEPIRLRGNTGSPVTLPVRVKSKR
jgi:hypothetical protein